MIWRMILKKFPKVPVQNYEKIKQMDLGQIDVLGLEVLDMKEQQELERFL